MSAGGDGLPTACGDRRWLPTRGGTQFGAAQKVPSRAALEVLAAAVANRSLRPVVDQVLELADAALAHRRIESRRPGKVVLRVAR